ncbi:Ig-like domain-containing protein [Thalassomonas sp. M1454]|uniref:Ig-like domain-containing protein n=1 Tax=Thalassomonas sp. M1454 TaxID=2594477 RepID=UPI00117F0A27|nr:Ig-like domain-containing protein [Thalassomonas sp. M1454]TRX57998.1 hypothetical protein FNN08_01015 [Thalassomonas sp. M1454]
MNSLLKKTTILAALSVSLLGCDDVDEGYANNFKNDNPVGFSMENIAAEFEEVSGIQQVNLLEGAMVDGEPLTLESSSSPIYIRDFNFETLTDGFTTPQAPGFANNQGVSPFTIGDDGVTLEIDTDAFAEALRMCDPTDVRGAVDENNNPIGNGVRDFPTLVEYSITYVVDNGYEYAPGEEHPVRTLELTITAGSDPVANVQAFDINVASGDSVPMLSATAPAYSCNSNLTYDVADTSIASVDENGVITGNNKGQTTITVASVENPELTATATINVTPGFNLLITNQEFNDLGAPLGTKAVPTCSAIGVNVEPTIVADELSGEYTYAWSSDSLVLAKEETTGGFSATGRFANTLAVGESADITVGYGSGYSGSTAAGDVQPQMVTVTAERNLACDPGLNADGTDFFASDLKLDSGNWGASATHVAEGLDGTSLQITSTNGGKFYGGVVQQQWNQVFNYHAATYGRGGASIGRTFKFKVWAKLGQLPTEEVKLEHSIIPWNCDGCDGLANYPARIEAGVAGTVTAVLKPTTDWQLVEFINPLTGTDEWSVPAHFNVSTAAFLSWDIYGFADGETILLDNYSIVEVE